MEIDILGYDKDCVLYYSRVFQKVFAKKGIETRLLHFDGVNTREELQKILSSPPDCLLGIALAGFDPILLTPGFRTKETLQEELPLLCDLLRIPYISYQLDPPVGFWHYFCSEYTTYVHCDRLTCEGLKKIEMPRVAFMPYGVDSALFEGEEKERSYPLVFMGACYDPLSVRESWEKIFPRRLCHEMEGIVEAMEHDNHSPLIEIFERERQKRGLTERLDELFKESELMLRARERNELLEALCDFEIHVFGGNVAYLHFANRGWETYLQKFPNITWHPQVSYEESLEVMKKSKIVLNSCPVFRGMSHDRVMNGLACGALVVTNDNPFTKEQFSQGEGVVTFRPKQWEPLRQTIASYLADEERRRVEVAIGQKKVQMNHTWELRLEELLKEVGALFS